MDTRKVLAHCEICRRPFEIAELLQSNGNDFYCRDCFKRNFYSGNRLSGAGDTKTDILTRVGAKMIPHPEMYVQSAQTTYLLHGPQNMSTMSLSKRPLQCPKADCNKFISVCTLESHFKHEHMEVPIVSTHLDARCASEFYPRDIRYCITQCIVLLKVINAEFLTACRTREKWPRVWGVSLFSKVALTSLSSEEQKPVMVLMSTRIADIHLTENDEDEYDESPERPGKSSHEEVFREGDRIIVWLASNINTNLSYTVAVSTWDNEIRQKYFGSMLTLNESPEKLCREGNCLILTHIHCIAMTENGTKPLALDVVIHGPE